MGLRIAEGQKALCRWGFVLYRVVDACWCDPAASDGLERAEGVRQRAKEILEEG